MTNPSQTQSAGGSVSDILTTLKNLVVALNAATQAFLNVNGVSTTEAITAPTVVKSSPGRVASVSIIVPGSASGMIYDSVATGITAAPLWIIPNAVASDGEPYKVNMATDSGILVVPGSGMTVTVCWS
jgi:hypothetical protein